MVFEHPIPDSRTVTRWDVIRCAIFGHKLKGVRFYTGQWVRRCTRCGAWRP